MLPRILKGLWALLALTPLLIYRTNGMGLNQAGLNTFAAVFFYVLGWVLLRVALSRDPKAEVLISAFQSKAVRVAAIGAILFVQFLGITTSGVLMLITLLGLSVFLFALWAWRRTGESFAQTVENLLLMTTSMGILLALGEFVCRRPQVVAITGGDTPGMARWAEQNYDRISDVTPYGVRSFHLDRPKRQGVFRIVTLGDSYTWGSKIGRTEDLWPYVLERLLTRKERPVEVINLARPGFTTVNEAEMLDRMGWLFEPDLVILEFTLNDTIPSGPNFFHRSEDWYFRIFPLIPVFHRVLDDRSYLYSFVNARFRGLQMQMRYRDGYAPLFEDDFDGWRACQDALRKIADQAKQRDVPVVGMIFPMFLPTKMDEASYQYTAVHKKVRAAMESAGMSVLDLRPVYAKFGRTGRSWWALPCDAHPSVEAHRVAAKALKEKIEELNLIPAPPSQS
ncbi:MAG: SGNH/GDSL hydrolase family protein [Abditibacteriales bacterium]|nr:SGNH/GDSL hydrolase family protein [Abditibacteriales bacterium]MDW8366105.1 SGNH/GDSL hydrolase family protein [Abditibacteriales bacterium]